MADAIAPEGPADDSGARRLRAAFAAEERRGLELALRVRAVILVVLGIWISIENQYPEFLYFYPYLGVFALLGVAPLALRRRGVRGAWVRFVFPTLDVTVFAIMVLLPNPLEGDLFPVQMQLQYGNELYLFIFIASAVFTYSPAAVLWTGIWAALVWSAGTLVIYSLPETQGWIGDAAWQAMSDAERAQAIMDVRRVNLGLWGRQVVLLVLTGAALAAFVRRARHLVEQQADAERQRTNLSRYFSPNMVEELARADAPLGPGRQQVVAVLFADLVGFTRLAEAQTPPQVIALLRAFHGRMQAAVFAHGGTVDKYIGDAVMATFGTPRPGPDDATRALRCAHAMCAAMAAWNAERVARGEAPLRIGIGAHIGAVVLGDIGGESRLEFAVLGDTVNVASRLERLTRDLGVTLVASDALVAAARAERDPDCDALLADVVAGPAQQLRGRDQPVAIWTLTSPRRHGDTQR